MARKGGLGKGLEALIPGGFEPSNDSGGHFVAVTKIYPNPHQPRMTMLQEDLQELANSIREHGIIQPLIVTPSNVNDQYILIAGERRLRAAELAGLTMVPVIIRQANDLERLELALIENVQRADLSPLETAEAYRQLAEDFNLSHEEIATRVAKSRVTITNTLRLLKLPDPVRQALADGRISEGHARALLALPSPQAQTAACLSIVRLDLNVRQTEELVRKLGGEKTTKGEKSSRSPDLIDLENELRNVLGTRVAINQGQKGGTITIHYYSAEELEQLTSQLLKR